MKVSRPRLPASVPCCSAGGAHCAASAAAAAAAASSRLACAPRTVVQRVATTHEQ